MGCVFMNIEMGKIMALSGQWRALIGTEYGG
jgi:hypothetical protein